MSYRVLVEFADSQDGYHVYKAGDKFPRDGKLVSGFRIADLASDRNMIGKPLIEQIVIEEKPKRNTRTKKKE